MRGGLDGNVMMASRPVAMTIAVVACAAAGCGRSAPAPAPTETSDAKATATAEPIVALPETEPIVRVRVRRVRDAQGFELGVDDQWLRIGSVADPSDGARGATIVLQGRVRITRDGATWRLAPTNGDIERLEGEAIEATSIDIDMPTVAVDGQPHPGRLRLVARTSEGRRAFDVVNHVGVESYLPGVLARELYGHWKLETFMAQAIAARSFACAERDAFARTRHYDLTNTTRSQAYAGSETHRRAIEAVARTRGLVLGHDGGLVPGYYSSCCGGTPARGADAIGSHPINAIPPLDGRGLDAACGGSPVQVWTVTRDRARLARRLAADGRARSHALADLDGLASIEPCDTNGHGRPTRFAVTDPAGGRYEIEAETLRRAIDAPVKGLKNPERSLRSSNISVTISAGVVRIAGRGYGHGVGLCQFGAEARATDGAAHGDILAWYYPGAEIQQAYE